MNRTEQAKIEALSRCRMGWGAWDAHFINALVAMTKVDAKLILTARQKFMLDTLVFHYRRQLANVTAFTLPKEVPREVDYAASPPGQGALFV